MLHVWVLYVSVKNVVELIVVVVRVMDMGVVVRFVEGMNQNLSDSLDLIFTNY